MLTNNVLHQSCRVIAVVGTSVKVCDAIYVSTICMYVYAVNHARLISQVCMLRYLFLEVLTDFAMASEALGSLTTSCMQREAMQCRYILYREQ